MGFNIGIQCWKRAAALAALFLLAQGTVQAENSPFVEINGRRIPIEPAFEDYAFMLEDACKAMELSADDCLIYPMMGDITLNAFATDIDGNKVIIYDRRLSSLVGSDGAQAIIAHELGHHYCGHAFKLPDASHELEADMFAGAVMKNMNFSLEAAKSYAVLLSKQPSSTHPSRRLRENSIEAG